ncbi:CPCC family cysteine-rich protein [Amycolatopsis coloradensis]|uniref:CPCC family cysteine-rich protein n=1 Tax=Amycolatopsis coloradensis TaxID=76021 RepID=UPI003CC91B4D
MRAECGADDGVHACPCCGYLTVGERGAYEICPVRFWEDDGQDDHDADVVRGGPNGRLSLTVTRLNFDLTVYSPCPAAGTGRDPSRRER